MPNDVEAVIDVDEKTEVNEDAAPSVIQFPKSTVILPLPTLCVGEVNPVNSKV